MHFDRLLPYKSLTNRRRTYLHRLIKQRGWSDLRKDGIHNIHAGSSRHSPLKLEWVVRAGPMSRGEAVLKSAPRMDWVERLLFYFAADEETAETDHQESLAERTWLAVGIAAVENGGGKGNIHISQFIHNFDNPELIVAYGNHQRNTRRIPSTIFENNHHQSGNLFFGF